MKIIEYTLVNETDMFDDLKVRAEIISKEELPGEFPTKYKCLVKKIGEDEQFWVFRNDNGIQKISIGE